MEPEEGLEPPMFVFRFTKAVQSPLCDSGVYQKKIVRFHGVPSFQLGCNLVNVYPLSSVVNPAELTSNRLLQIQSQTTELKRFL